ncbi:preprotein translocase subunit SecE [Azoarcus sp. PA01]|nr:preprotein translocase subunit SecE [Azoarcus sp. PA01]
MTDYVTHAEFGTAMDRIEGRFAHLDHQFGELREEVRGARRSTWQAAAGVVGVMVAITALVLAAIDTGRESAAREFSAAAVRLEAAVKSAPPVAQPPIIINVPPSPAAAPLPQ